MPHHVSQAKMLTMAGMRNDALANVIEMTFGTRFLECKGEKIRFFSFTSKLVERF